jgi:hypothetical protein
MMVDSSTWSYAFSYPIWEDTSAGTETILPYGPLLVWFLSLLDMDTLKSRRVNLLRACQPFNILFPIANQDQFIDASLSQMGSGLVERYRHVKIFIMELRGKARASRCYVLNIFGLISFKNIGNYKSGIYNSAPQRIKTFLPITDRAQNFPIRLQIIERYILTGEPMEGIITPINVVEFLQDVLGNFYEELDTLSFWAKEKNMSSDVIARGLNININIFLFIDQIGKYSNTRKEFYFYLTILMKIFPVRYPQTVLSLNVDNDWCECDKDNEGLRVGIHTSKR